MIPLIVNIFFKVPPPFHDLSLLHYPYILMLYKKGLAFANPLFVGYPVFFSILAPAQQFVVD